MKRILISLLLQSSSYGLFLTCCPLTMMAMEEKQQDNITTPKNIYAGVIATVLNCSSYQGADYAFPVARQTLIYKLPQPHTDKDTFEYVDAVEEWNEPHGQVKHIETRSVAYIKIQSLSFLEQNTKVSINGYDINSIYYPVSTDSFTATMKLGSIVSITPKEIITKPMPKEIITKPAYFGKSTSSSSQPEFLPHSSFFAGTTESTTRNDRLAKNPNNTVLTTIAFLRLEERCKGSNPTYIPSPCTDLTTILEQDSHTD